MITAARAYPTDPDFQQKAQYLMAKYPDAVEILLYPITQPLNAKNKHRRGHISYEAVYGSADG